ncbi:unnamed protein product [Moneuplotes crassus]|uniref:Uncharacterized protein n=1 Tax=Euplotes crassus TaxID=5936 RepID=A0AAD1U9U3_EUPCR|nr:unnamed protein product [Moneuplotes crassus]
MDLSPPKSGIKKLRKKTLKKLSVGQVPQIVISRAISKKFINGNQEGKSKSGSGSRGPTSRKKSFIYLKKRGKSNEKKQDKNILLPPLLMQHIGSQVCFPKISNGKNSRKVKKSPRGSISHSKSGKRKKTLTKITLRSNNSFKGLGSGTSTPSRIVNFLTKTNSSSKKIDANKKGKPISEVKTQVAYKRNSRSNKLETNPLYAGLPKSLKSQFQSRPHKMPSSKDVKPKMKVSSNSIFPPTVVTKKVKSKQNTPRKIPRLQKEHNYKASFESPFNKKHDTSQVSQTGFASMVEAKLNLTNMIQNSATIEDLLNMPSEGSYLQCNASKNSPIRKKSPKEVKILQVSEEIDLYQETNLGKRKSSNGKNLTVKKVFKKKDAVRYILNRKDNSQHKLGIRDMSKTPTLDAKRYNNQFGSSQFSFNPIRVANQYRIPSEKSQIEHTKIENSQPKEEAKIPQYVINYDKIRYEDSIHDPQISNIEYESSYFMNKSLRESLDQTQQINLSDIANSVSSRSRRVSPENLPESQSKFPKFSSPKKPNERYKLIDPTDDSLVVLQESRSTTKQNDQLSTS